MGHIYYQIRLWRIGRRCRDLGTPKTDAGGINGIELLNGTTSQ